jgi:hypothetical protein
MKQGMTFAILTGTMAVAAIAALATDGPPQFEVTRYTIDGGGAMRSSGGEFELSGTIGQPETGVMDGSGFTLSGGFWFSLPQADCNDDGLVNLLDHETFLACLLGPNGGIDASQCPCFDTDADRSITLSDYARLQSGFTGQ